MNRYYLLSIYDTVKFLALNELSFRGTSEQEQSIFSCGNFLNLLSYTMQKDSKLNDNAKTIPEYAKYTSPDMQNAIIENMASIV